MKTLNFKFRIIFLIFFVFETTSCQIDESLSKIKESITNIEFNHGEELKKKEAEEEKKSNEKKKKEYKKIKKAEAEAAAAEEEENKLQLDAILNSENYEEKESITKGKGLEVLTEKERNSFFAKLFGSGEDAISKEKETLEDDTEENDQEFSESENEPISHSEYEILSKDNFEMNVNEEEKINMQLVGKEEDSPHISEKVEDEISKEILDNKETQTAFFLPQKRTKAETEKTPYSKNFVGLLVPLSGNKKSAGELVLNSIKFSISKKSSDMIFKIYDTRGTPQGALEVTKKAVKNGVKVFIGPIFSDETKILKDNFGGDDILFFSLSTDFSNSSENIIITGQSPQDQVFCITKNLVDMQSQKILLIHHNNQYGQIVKNNLMTSVKNLNALDRVELSFFEITGREKINEEIRVLSDFDKRKSKLENKINSIKEDLNLSKGEKKVELKKLERQLTLDSPFDSIIIASEGDRLLEILSHLAFYDINSKNTVLYGTSLWEDTPKKDKIYENTFFVSNLKIEESLFFKDYENIFAKKPITINYQLLDLIDLIEEFKISQLNYPESKVYIGEFGNSFIKEGFLRRETYIKNIKNQKIKNFSKCYLDVL